MEAAGKSVHSAHASLGINAIDVAVRALTAIQGNYQAPFSESLGEGSLVATDIISDPYPGRSVVPSRCVVTFDRRVLLGETPQSVLQSLDDCLSPEAGVRVRLASYDFRTHTGIAVKGESFAPPWYFDSGQERVQMALAGLNRVGIAARIRTYGFCTNGSSSAGKRNIFTLGFGPGDEGAAHTADESLAIEQLVEAVRGYKELFSSLTGG
jgi:acetylornithine deacetylase/succinyl-diaminopimelate desuccinylase-like protein